MNWRCVIGLHDWDEFGECRRDFMHVQNRSGDWVLYGGHYSRVMKQRYAVKRRAGEALQQRFARMGEDVSLALCADVARDPVMVNNIIDVIEERRARRLARAGSGSPGEDR